MGIREKQYRWELLSKCTAETYFDFNIPCFEVESNLKL